MVTFVDTMALVEKLTTEEIRALMASRLGPTEANGFSGLTRNVSREVLVLAAVRALLRLSRSAPTVA